MMDENVGGCLGLLNDVEVDPTYRPKGRVGGGELSFGSRW